MTGKILVVDDVAANTKLLEAKLKAEYYVVKTAASGIEALEVLAEGSYDVILLDVMMPGMDGFEACREIKKNPKTAAIPVIMVTALSDAQDRLKGLEAGADDFLTKPINDLALIARIRSLMRLKSIADELALRNATSSELGLNVTPNVADISTDGASVVIIDDNANEAFAIADLFYDCKINVKVIDNPVDVDKEIERDSEVIDLVMISCYLKNHDGLRIATNLRSNATTKFIPQLVVVNEEDNDIIIKALDMGVNDYLITPVDINESLARVATQIKRKRFHHLLKQNYQQSVSMALVDSLTGIYNRNYFDVHYPKTFEQARQNDKYLAVMMLDIDFFKKVNDEHGHQTGDLVLRDFAKILRQLTRITDFIARYGGEEFTMMMNVDKENANIIAERIRKLVEDFNFKTVEDQPIKVTCSIGVTMCNANDNTETLLKRADDALYKSKENGRNKVTMAD
ncbi:MAG: PleD family two-component system response regulator [Pseudomonadota bacterium]